MTGPSEEAIGRVGRTAREVAQTWAQVLLEKALDSPSAQPILEHHENGDSVGALASFLDEARPIVCVKSQLAYAERLIAEMVFTHPGSRLRRVVTTDFEQAWSGNEPSIPSFDDDSLLVLSFHEPTSLPSMLRFVHRLSTTDNPVFIGCRHLTQVPEILRSRIDLQLELPIIDAEAFARIFEKLFGCAMASHDHEWTQAAEPGDLQLPYRLGYSAEAAYRHARERVEARLRDLEPSGGPGLDEIHGMGEACEIAHDLVAEIRAARDGILDWRDLDRGMLLSGPPGTGKTMLIRALAAAAGIKVVMASAPGWQAVDTLGAHLNEIRRSFDEARRYQPAILFIDEMDALGSREKLAEDRASDYQRTVINYLLEQIDGFVGRENVIVIGATNHEELVDPALRRSGRLDQTVRVPFPTSSALAEIYRYHLRPHLSRGRCADDIDHRELGGLSFGLTGADVEFFVRGASRRARRRGARIGHADLVAEILRKPRGSSSHERLDSDAVRRLAVHQAGHALARLRSETGGLEISYVSVAPRSDGRIGHLATIEPEKLSLTREDVLAKIRILLAGRAAEQLVFGEDGISDLAGRNAGKSDLARATAWATSLHGSSGLDVERLLWLEGAGPAARIDLGADVENTLSELYGEVVSLMETETTLLESIVQELLTEQEISGAQLRAAATVQSAS